MRSLDGLPLVLWYIALPVATLAVCLAVAGSTIRGRRAGRPVAGSFLAAQEHWLPANRLVLALLGFVLGGLLATALQEVPRPSTPEFVVVGLVSAVPATAAASWLRRREGTVALLDTVLAFLLPGALGYLFALV